MTFTPLPGAIDFSKQTAESLQLLLTRAISINLPQAFDITPNIYPNLQALLIVWQADGSIAGQQLILSATFAGSTFGAGPQQATLIDDTGSWLVPVPSSIVTSQPGTQAATIGVQRPTGAPNPVFGTLYIFGVMSNPLAVPVVRRAYIGQGLTANATIAASSTQTLLAFPPSGCYYRLKLLGYTSIAAPGSANRITFQSLNGGQIWSIAVPATANQTFSTPLDWETDDGVKVVNGTSSGAPVTCAYELWRA